MEQNRKVLLRATDLCQWFPVKKMFYEKQKYVKAVDHVSFELYEGETLGVAGESGCGKSTLIRTCLRLLKPTSGTVEFDGQDISRLSKKELRAIRRNMQIVFQDPYSALDNRCRVGNIIAEPLLINHLCGNKAGRMERVRELMQDVGLDPSYTDRFPHEFSGGQRQRIVIARALATTPKLLMCDEAVSALDVSVRAQVLNLLKKLQREYSLTYLFVSHDMSVVEHICDRVIIMYLGRIMEIGSKRDIFGDPQHPYTQALLSAVPSANEDVPPEKRIILKGRVPSPVDPPPGCVFHTRCRYAEERCKTETPVLTQVGENGHCVACHRCSGQ